MNKLIIESGATKSEWCFLEKINGEIYVNQLTSKGWNASSSKEDISKNDIQIDWISKADKIYFYGAGVSSEYSSNRVRSQLNDHPDCTIESDLKAACVSSLGASEGICAILGTGSISCLWDGKEMNIAVPSLGYLLSDEGSGSDLGKEVLRGYFYKTMPEELRVKFFHDYNLTASELIDNLYSKPGAKGYLANFSKFLSTHPHTWCENLIKERLNKFFEIRIVPLYNKKIKKIGFIGSVSFVFKHYLMELCDRLEINDVVIYPSAMEGLINYHKNYE